jgi:hypothetical protein
MALPARCPSSAAAKRRSKRLAASCMERLSRSVACRASSTLGGSMACPRARQWAMALYAGQSVGLVRDLAPAADIVARLAAQTSSVLDLLHELPSGPGYGTP